MVETRRAESAARHVVRGALVSLGGALSLGSRLLGFVALAILARLLLPHDFGIVATAMIFIGLCRTLMNRQFHLALIRLPEVEQSHYDTAFTLTLIWGLVASAGLFTPAGLLARVMGTPEIEPVLRVMALALCWRKGCKARFSPGSSEISTCGPMYFGLGRKARTIRGLDRPGTIVAQLLGAGSGLSCLHLHPHYASYVFAPTDHGSRWPMPATSLFRRLAQWHRPCRLRHQFHRCGADCHASGHCFGRDLQHCRRDGPDGNGLPGDAAGSGDLSRPLGGLPRSAPECGGHFSMRSRCRWA